MNRVLLLFLSLSLSGTILAFILMAIKPIIKSKFSQTWQYYIWLVVILRFLFPFTPQVSMVSETVRYFHNIIVSSAVIEISADINGNQENFAPIFPQEQYASQITQSPQTSEAEEATQIVYWNEILNNVWVLWLGAAFVLFANKAASYRSFVRFVKVGTKKMTDPNILVIYEEELTAAKINRPLPLYINEHVNSPMLIGILQPSIVIPILKVDNDELRHILRHELTHHKRLDFLYKWIVQIVFCLHWFNPLMHLISKEINRLCELSCDQSIIERLDMSSRIVYGDALISSLKTQESYSDFVVSITMSNNAKLIKERLDVMMNYKKKSSLVLCATAFLTALLLCGFAFTGAQMKDIECLMQEIVNVL